jgi:hypothetical protein
MSVSDPTSGRAFFEPTRLPSNHDGSKNGPTRAGRGRTTSRAASDAAARFRILLPATWMILPLAPEGRQQRIRRLVRRRVGTSDELAAARYAAATELERAAEAAVKAGVFFAATYDELFGDVPVSASLTVSVNPIGLPPSHRRRTDESRPDAAAGHTFFEPERLPSNQSGSKNELPGPDGHEDGSDGAADAQSDRPGSDGPLPGSDGHEGCSDGAADAQGEGSVSDGLAGVAQRMAERLEGERSGHDELGVVELPLGSAVRCRTRVHCDLWGSDGKELRPATVQYLVPLVGGDHMLVMSFSTPILPLADRFAELFDAMSRTARID